MENRIKICKGGKLYLDGSETNGFPTAHHLHECTIELEEDLTLGDIFFLLKRDLDKWDDLLGNWCSEFVTEGLKPRLVTEKEEDDMKLDYLEIYRVAEIDNFEEGEVIMSGIGRLDFGGMGHYIKDCDNMGVKAGHEMGICITFTPANELAPYPIKIKRDYDIWYHDYSKEIAMSDEPDEEKRNPKKAYTITNMEVTLFDFLYAIMWELSFHGGPDKRDKSKQELLERVKEAGIGVDKKS